MGGAVVSGRTENTWVSSPDAEGRGGSCWRGGLSGAGRSTGCSWSGSCLCSGGDADHACGGDCDSGRWVTASADSSEALCVSGGPVGVDHGLGGVRSDCATGCGSSRVSGGTTYSWGFSSWSVTFIYVTVSASTAHTPASSRRPRSRDGSRSKVCTRAGRIDEGAAPGVCWAGGTRVSLAAAPMSATQATNGLRTSPD